MVRNYNLMPIDGLSTGLQNYMTRGTNFSTSFFRYLFDHGISLSNPYELNYIDPNDVEYLLAPQFSLDFHRNFTYMVGGSWDITISDKEINYSSRYEDGFHNRKLISFDNFIFYQSLVDHFISDVPWTETTIYDYMSERQVGKYDDPANRFKQIDRLYDSMKENGYLTQQELSEQGNSPMSRNDFKLIPQRHEVMINIGRDGKLIFEEGRHRFCIARILNIDRIPVRVFVKHKKYIDG